MLFISLSEVKHVYLMNGDDTNEIYFFLTLQDEINVIFILKKYSFLLYTLYTLARQIFALYDAIYDRTLRDINDDAALCVSEPKLKPQELE